MSSSVPVDRLSCTRPVATISVLAPVPVSWMENSSVPTSRPPTLTRKLPLSPLWAARGWASRRAAQASVGWIQRGNRGLEAMGFSVG